MADLLAPVGAVVVHRNGTPLGTVTRATASSVWVGTIRLVGAFSYDGDGGLRRFGSIDRFADYYIADSPAGITRRRRLAEESERDVASLAIRACRQRMAGAFDAATAYGSAPHAERVARAEQIAAAVEAMFKGET